MSEYQICVSVFDTETQHRFTESRRDAMRNKCRVLKYKENDRVILWNMETNRVFGVGRLRAFQGTDCIYRETDLLDHDLYPRNADYAKHNKYEIGVEVILFDEEQTVAEIHRACGHPTSAPIMQGQRTSFKKPANDLRVWMDTEIKKRKQSQQ